MSKRVQTKSIQGTMWNMGRPTHSAEFANIYRAAIKAGLNEDQALALTNLAYDTAQGYEWKIQETAGHLRFHTQRRQAEEHPNGKCAEDLKAASEGRPSRWGTPEFHRACWAALRRSHTSAAK